MYVELYQFLIQHKQLSLPGIGTLILQKESAGSDIASRKINPPSYSLTLRDSVSSSKNFFIWLAEVFHVTERDAIIRFNDFVYEMRNQINGGNTIAWNGVGSLKRGAGGEIEFSPFVKGLSFEQPIKAEKIIREKAEHLVRVGEDERTSTQMVEWLSQSNKKRFPWWAYALIIGLLSVMFLGWYFSEHGLKVSSTANQKSFTPAKTR